MSKAMDAAKLLDGDVTRAVADIALMLATPQEALAAPGIVERITTLGGGAARFSCHGPSRPDLLAALAG
ncbi:hypothetical protein [Planotetraspora sp. GP83]|uniref:hypothetical protein n=1 Tax=Planotetraspora sp. GP83 TaxID=3156264 RepID=UPI0035151BDC